MSGNPSALAGVETAESKVVAVCQVGKALCRPRAALGSNYSERSIFARRFHASRVGVAVQSAVIYGRKLDKRASASRPIGRRLLRVVAFSSRWRIPHPSRVSWPERKYRCAIYDNGVATVLNDSISSSFSELCIIS